MPRTRKDYVATVDEKTIGKRLRELRLHWGMTQVELAEKLGINQSLVSEYELGTVRIHAALLAAFAKALRASADDILGLEKPKQNGNVNDRRFLRRLEKAKRLSKRDQEVLLRSLDAFLKGAGVE